MLALCLVLGISACGNTSAPSESQVENESESAPISSSEAEISAEASESQPESSAAPEEEKTLVVYFSATGTTKGVAEKIAALTGADIYEIVPAEPYTDEDLDYGNDQSRTTLEMNDENARPEIGGEDISLEGYSTVYIGYPIWWGEAPRIMSTFAESHDFTGMTVIPFCTSGGSGIGESGDILAGQAGTGNWLSGERFGGNVSEADLQTWIDELK